MIPDYQSLMLPLLQYAADGEEHSLRESIEALSASFSLSENDRTQLLPSGRQPVMDNRVGWARTYIAKAGLLEVTRRGHFRITDRGRDVLREKPESINVRTWTVSRSLSAFVSSPDNQVGTTPRKAKSRPTPRRRSSSSSPTRSYARLWPGRFFPVS